MKIAIPLFAYKYGIQLGRRDSGMSLCFPTTLCQLKWRADRCRPKQQINISSLLPWCKRLYPLLLHNLADLLPGNGHLAPRITSKPPSRYNPPRRRHQIRHCRLRSHESTSPIRTLHRVCSRKSSARSRKYTTAHSDARGRVPHESIRRSKKSLFETKFWVLGPGSRVGLLP